MSRSSDIATAAGCIGAALGLFDTWLSGHDPAAPAGLTTGLRLQPGHWVGERAAIGILTLTGKGRAFRSRDTLQTRQGGQQVLYGAASALAATAQAWTRHTQTPLPELLRAALR